MHDVHNNLAPLHISNLLTYTHDIGAYMTIIPDFLQTLTSMRNIHV
jgi:hypothetical protein